VSEVVLKTPLGRLNGPERIAGVALPYRRWPWWVWNAIGRLQRLGEGMWTMLVRRQEVLSIRVRKKCQAILRRTTLGQGSSSSLSLEGLSGT